MTPTPPAGAGAHGTGTGSTAVGEDPISVSTSSRPGVEDRSLGDIVGKLTSDFSTLVRQEVELAKVELKEEATKAGKGAGMLGGAGVVGNLALVFASLTLMFLLDKVMDIALAALIVTLLWAVVAAVLAAKGRKELKQVNLKPERTIDTLKEDARWAKTPTS